MVMDSFFLHELTNARQLLMASQVLQDAQGKSSYGLKGEKIMVETQL